MNKMKFMVLFMSVAMIFSGCASMNNTGKGAAIGGGSGAALGAILGGVIGKGKGAAIGAAIGTAVGAGTGALIGKKMDKAAAEAKQIEGAQVEQITDNNGLKAVKVTFDSGILFTTGNASLSPAAKSAFSGSTRLSPGFTIESSSTQAVTIKLASNRGSMNNFFMIILFKG